MTTGARALVNITTQLDGGQAKSGTGIVIDSHGIVLTNYHVVSGATALQAFDHGNRATYTATVIGADLVHDIALIRLRDAEALPTAQLGNSNTVRAGDRVASIGNTDGHGALTVGAGPVTGLGRSITSTAEPEDLAPNLAAASGSATASLTGLIQAQTSIRPGQSGGALINARGQVVGVNVAFGTSAGSRRPNGTGFAIPINTAMRIAHRILTG